MRWTGGRFAGVGDGRMKFPCAHWQSCGKSFGGCCAIKDKSRSFGTCLECAEYQGPERTEAFRHKWITLSLPSKGLGDTLNKGITIATSGNRKPCKLCRKIELGLNKALAYA